MPNWCSTEVTMFFDNMEEREKIEKLIEEFSAKKFLDGVDNNWLGNIVGNAELGKWNGHHFVDKNGNQIHCRGSIEYINSGEVDMHIFTETAWCPMVRMWQMFLDKYAPTASLSYNAEECGSGIYWTNDPNIEGDYVIDVYGDAPDDMEDAESDYYADENTTREFCQKALHTDEADMDKLLEKVRDKLGWVSVHRWEHHEAEDCD